MLLKDAQHQVHGFASLHRLGYGWAATVIDVTDPEPLPPTHLFWRHPTIWLTPHIASQTQAESAVAELLENLRH